MKIPVQAGRSRRALTVTVGAAALVSPAAPLAALAPAGAAAAGTGGPPAAVWLVGGLILGVLLGALAALLWTRRPGAAARAGELRQALDGSADWIWRSDAAGQVHEARGGRRALAGLDPARLVGRPPWQLHDDAQPCAELRQALDARAPFYDLPVLTGRGAAARVLALSGVPLHATDGSFAGYAGSGRDVTALVGPHPGADLPDDRAAELEAAVAERTRQLELAVKELESFSYSVSHDLRAPLRVVDGFATIVLEDYGGQGRPLDELGREHLKRIVAAGARMNSMIDTLLTLSRMTSRDIAHERVDLSHLARELADELASGDRGRAAQFIIGEGLTADGDRTLLRLVLQNLLGNAWKFTARQADARIEFGARQADGHRVYFVRDNGAGFDMRFADKMFGLFQRFHSQNEFPGTGVGLATVQRVVRKHGGRIWAEAVPAPAPDHGACFSFTLWERAG